MIDLSPSHIKKKILKLIAATFISKVNSSSAVKEQL